jgi:4'-phosphopantetheinyl transferase
VWVASLEPPDRVRDDLAEILAPAERERAERFVVDRDRRRFVAARAFLRLLLSRELGTSARALEFETGAHGKPSIASRWGLHFNVAHSGELAVCAIVRGPDLVGVDVEHVRPLGGLDGVACAAMSAREFARYETLATPDDRLRAFYDAWTRKEALLKASGDGLSRSPKELDVGFELSANAPSGKPREVDGAWLHAFEPRPDYVGALAVGGAPRALAMRWWTWP